MAKELLPILVVLASVTGVYSQEPVDVKAGDIVALHCPWLIVPDHSDAKVVWTRYSPQDTTVISDMPPAKQTHMGVLLHGRSLVIFSASVNHQGNYSCSLGNADNQFWFRLTVYNQPSAEIEKRNRFSRVCYTQESCTLTCPDRNIPDVNTPNISTFPNIRWHKDGKLLQNNGYFQSVEKKYQGVYTCTRSYLYRDQTYNITFTVALDIQPKVPKKTEAIISPHNNEIFEVDLGSMVVVDCKAVVYSQLDGIFWLRDSLFVGRNESFPVFYNSTRENKNKEIKLTASLIFKKVSEEDLSVSYVCKLDSVSQAPSIVTIFLARKPRPSYASLARAIVCIIAVTVATVVIYVSFKIDITLFVRDTLGCHRSPSDGKSYDAFLLCYKSDTGAGLNDCDRKWLESVLEMSCGYTLCLCERDVSPGEAEAEAVLDCIKKSRAVVLVPTCSDSDPGSGLLSAIHEALVERQSHLIFIKTKTTMVAASATLPEALEHLGEAGDYVTWRGEGSMATSSSFLKHLRYFLPAPQHPPRARATLAGCDSVVNMSRQDQ